MAAENGEFSLFALFLRHNALNGWDLIASAPWLDPGDRESYKRVYEYLGRSFGAEDFARIARVVILDPSDPEVVRSSMPEIAQGRNLRKVNFAFGGVDVRLGYFLAAGQSPPPEVRKVRKNRRRVGD